LLAHDLDPRLARPLAKEIVVHLCWTQGGWCFWADPSKAAKLFGHTTPRVTLEIYSHITPAADARRRGRDRRHIEGQERREWQYKTGMTADVWQPNWLSKIGAP
jgi:hypothetical protein